jgi:hypothetical protein
MVDSDVALELVFMPMLALVEVSSEAEEREVTVVFEVEDAAQMTSCMMKETISGSKRYSFEVLAVLSGDWKISNSKGTTRS